MYALYAPVRTGPPAQTPVTLAETKAHLRVDGSEEDVLISSMIASATDNLDGWTGILGACLVEQEWRQDFDRFSRWLALPLRPVTSIVSVKWRAATGQELTVAPASYSLVTDPGGRSHIRFRNDFTSPSDLDESRAVSVAFKAGYGTEDGVSTVPPAIKAAILLHVDFLYKNRGSGASMDDVPPNYHWLLTPFSRMRV